VGAFKNCNARPCEFSKITLIYGRNTYGKTTLSDIFSSLKNNNPRNILSRKSIPVDAETQRIEMSFSQGGDARQLEKSIFHSEQWQKNIPEPLQLAIYNDDFYYSHVFSARGVSRENKENFSDFVLGEQGVEKARIITEKNKEKRTKTGRKSKLEKDAFSDVEELEEFIQLELVDDIEAVKLQRKQARQDYAELLKQQKEAQAIKARSNIIDLQFDASMLDACDGINKVFAEKLENQHEAAKAELDNHIKRSFTKLDGAEQWIQQGLGYIKDSNCSFCGQ